MGDRLRTDPLTGDLTVHPDNGREHAHTRRVMPAQRGTCPFCRITASRIRPVADEPILARRRLATVVTNRHPVWNARPGHPDSGVNELVFGPTHASSWDELATAEAADILAAADARCVAASTTYPYVGAFSNIGTNAGASLPHLHLQVVATHAGGGGAIARLAATPVTALIDDVTAADQDGRIVIREGSGSAPVTVWVPDAPAFPREVRITGTPDGRWADLAAAVVAVTGAWAAAGYDWPYNLLAWRDPSPWISLTPRLDAGIGYPYLFGCHIVMGDSAAYARELSRLVTATV